MPAKRLKSLALLATASVMISACGQPEPVRAVSDFCLNSVRISAEPDGADIGAGETTWEDEQPGNQFDTEETFIQVLAHNEVFDRLCAVGD